MSYSLQDFFFSVVQWHYKQWENTIFVKLQYEVKF